MRGLDRTVLTLTDLILRPSSYSRFSDRLLVLIVKELIVLLILILVEVVAIAVVY